MISCFLLGSKYLKHSWVVFSNVLLSILQPIYDDTRKLHSILCLGRELINWLCGWEVTSLCIHTSFWCTILGLSSARTGCCTSPNAPPWPFRATRNLITVRTSLPASKCPARRGRYLNFVWWIPPGFVCRFLLSIFTHYLYFTRFVDIYYCESGLRILLFICFHLFMDVALF